MKKIKKIIIGLILGLILVFTLAIAPQKIKADTTITDLTGYTWTGNDTLNIDVAFKYYIDFTELNTIDKNSHNFIESKKEEDRMKLFYGENNRVYSTTYGWSSNNYRVFKINGGTDCKNTQLINWLSNNGVLTKAEETINITSGEYRFIDVLVLGQTEFTGDVNITFTSNNQTFTGMRVTRDTLYYVNGNSEIEVFNIGVFWLVSDREYKNIVIGTTQAVSKDFYNWFVENTTKEVYYTITFNRNGATSGDLPPLQDVLSGTTFDLNNYNPGNLSKTDGTFIGWNTDASATTPLSSIVVNSDVLLYAIFSDNPKSVNIKITCRDNVVWQGNAIFNNNKIVGGVSWDDPTMTNVFFESLDSQTVTLINDKYGLNPNYNSNQLLLFFRPFSTEKDENGKYLAYINLIRLTTPKGTYAVNYTSNTSPKNINFDSWLATEGLTNMLKVDSDNYYFNLEVSWSLEEPLPPGVAEWGNVATIMARIMSSASTLLSINIGFITLGNLLLIVIALSVLFFVIKVWKGGN